MEADETKCPFCAETIKAEAVRCKHCHADLTNNAEDAGAVVDVQIKKKGMGIFSKILIGLMAAIVIFLGFGAIVGNTPEAKEKSRARSAINLCRKEEREYTGPVGSKKIITGACEKLENDFRTRFGLEP